MTNEGLAIQIANGLRQRPHVREDSSSWGIELHGDYAYSANVVGLALSWAMDIDDAVELCKRARRETPEAREMAGSATERICQVLGIDIPELEALARAHRGMTAKAIIYKLKHGEFHLDAA